MIRSEEFHLPHFPNCCYVVVPVFFSVVHVKFGEFVFIKVRQNRNGQNEDKLSGENGSRNVSVGVDSDLRSVLILCPLVEFVNGAYLSPPLSDVVLNLKEVI